MISPNEILTVMSDYGLLFVFVIVFFEYLNVPGFPGGFIFLAAGVWVAAEEKHFLPVLIVSVVAGLAGSLLLYGIGRWGGPRWLSYARRRFPDRRATIDSYTEKLRRRASQTVFVAKLLPVVRTLIGLPAGIVGMDMKKYLIFSGLGIVIWNAALMLIGFWFGDMFFEHVEL